MNECVFYGRVCKDIELRYTANQIAIAKFSIAVNRQYQNQDKKADFLNMTAFSKTAENIERFFRKGSRIVVRCHAQQEEYTNRDGQKVNTVGFIVDSFDFVDTRAEGGIAQNQPPQNPVQPSAAQPYSQQSMVDSEGWMNIPDGVASDLPFA